MKTPFHEFCLRTGVLCRDCEKKISGKELSETDFMISKLLISPDFSDKLSDVVFKKSFEGKTVVLIKLGGRSIEKIEESIKRIEEAISHLVGKRTILFEEGEALRAVAERLLYPAKIDSMRKSWLPDGSTVTTIRISGISENELPELSELLSSAYGTMINIYT